MTRVRSLLAATALLLASPAAAALDLHRADVSHLPNGLTVIMLEDHSLPVVSVQMLYKSGSAAEVRGKTGLAHFLEHLAFRGTANFPDAGATEAIYDNGGEWHGYTAMDQTTYFSTMPKGGLDLLLKIEADRMARVIIDPASIDAEKGAVITELHSYENDPASVLQEAVTRTEIQAHPYGSPIAGYVSDVATLTGDDAKAYYASHYAPGNAVLAIVGDFSPVEAKALIAREFADVAARAVAPRIETVEPPQNGERRIALHGPVSRPQFMLAYPAPAASSDDFPAFIVLQQLLSGSPGINAHQDGWAPTTALAGSALFGITSDIGTWLPVTRDPFLFSIGGSADRLSQDRIEAAIERQLSSLRERPVSSLTLDVAKASLSLTLKDDVQTTEDAAHQLAFFEGVGALDSLIALPSRIQSITAADVQRVARTYLAPNKRTVGWMEPGGSVPLSVGTGRPESAPDRAGRPPPPSIPSPATAGTLANGLSLFVQPTSASDSVTVELLMSGPVAGGVQPTALVGLGSLVAEGQSDGVATLIDKLVHQSNATPAAPDTPSRDPATRLEQLLAAQMAPRQDPRPGPLALFVSGNVDANSVRQLAGRRFERIAPTTLARETPAAKSQGPTEIRERIGVPLAQGAIGYVVEGPRPGTPDALAWRMLLYVLSHDYSGRLGRSAIGEKGLVYFIDSAQRTDGAHTWATLSIGVDPDKADAMEAELRRQLADLERSPPTAAELDAARNHLLGRDISAAQSSRERADKMVRQFVEYGRLQTHEELAARLAGITPDDVAKSAQSFDKGTIVRVDVVTATK